LIQGSSADALSERVVVAGDVWRNEPGQVHTIEAIEDSDVLEVSTPDLDDVIRLSDNYGREGTNAH
jgi:quercetin dioxygenase-like cupin family protein